MANLGVALGIGQAAFAIALMVALLRAISPRWSAPDDYWRRGTRSPYSHGREQPGRYQFPLVRHLFLAVTARE